MPFVGAGQCHLSLLATDANGRDRIEMKPPPWSREELIVALEFYLRHTPSIPHKGSTAIAELSDFLNRLGKKLHGEISATYRNPNGVYMKMMNLRRFDPDYTGSAMQRGNKDEEAVWNLYSSNRSELVRVAESIRSLVLSVDPLPPRRSFPMRKKRQRKDRS